MIQEQEEVRLDNEYAPQIALSLLMLKSEFHIR